ncbi:MAG: glycogen synthase GlgA [Thermodesulfovibrio sp.]|nr:glycogen synthase GlgA [Thermodesulfovibrio sp.]
MRIIIASSEAVPYVKTGGLADVAGALLHELRGRGEQVSLVLPLYCGIRERFPLHDTGRTFTLQLGGVALAGAVWASDQSPVPAVYFIECEELFGRTELYGTARGDYYDNALRFAFFSRAVLETCLLCEVRPDVIHCNDWQTGLVPLYLKDLYRDHPHFRRTATVMTIHNLGYQGLFNKLDLRYTGLGWEYFTVDRLEFHDMLNYLKAGLVYADVINTVSLTYALEILTAEHGFGLDGLLRSRKSALYGITNGIDYEEFNPAHDRFIPARYSRDGLENRAACRKALREQAGLENKERPIIGLVGRFSSQKGLDLVSGAIAPLLRMGVDLVILGKGEEYYHDLLAASARQHPGRVSVTIGFREDYARLIYAGADFFLMPSRYEPCGLGQLIALRYGSVPVARRTGGLADTIRDYDSRTWQGTGFLFDEYTVEALLAAVSRALAVYRSPERFQGVLQAGMAENFSWERAAGRYLMLYRKAVLRVPA